MTKNWFDVVIMFVIMLSSVALAAEDPVTEKSPRNRLLAHFDIYFTTIFGVECLLKVREKANFQWYVLCVLRIRTTTIPHTHHSN